MVYRVEPETGKVHEIYSVWARNVNGMSGVNRVDTTCGRSVTGRTGHSAYNEAVTCGSCRRIMNSREET